MLQTTNIYLFNSHNQILLGMKKRGFGEWKWNGFGGKNKGNETIIETAIRELYEESWVTIIASQLEKAGILHFFYQSNPDRNCDVHIFCANYDGAFIETDEMLPQWWDFDKIPFDQMREDDKIRMPKLINKEFPIDMSFNFDLDGKLI